MPSFKNIRNSFKRRIDRTERQQEEEDTAMRGRFFNRAYHKYFEDYTEYTVAKPNGRAKIVRVYTGTLYTQDLSSAEFVMIRLLFTFLTIAAIALFIAGSVQDIGYNYVRYVAVFEALCVPFLFYQLILMIGYDFADHDMDVHNYRLYHTNWLTVTKWGSIAHAATAASMLLYMVIHMSFSLQIFTPVIYFLAAALALLLINRMENSIDYKTRKSPDVQPPGGIKISDASKRRK